MIITIEGIDGAGKETQAWLLEAHFKAQGQDVSAVSFPILDSSPSGRLVKHLMRTDKYEELAVAFAWNRAEHRDLLKRTDIVIVDRYIDSNIVYYKSRTTKNVGWIEIMEYYVLGLPSDCDEKNFGCQR